MNNCGPVSCLKEERRVGNKNYPWLVGHQCSHTFFSLSDPWRMMVTTGGWTTNRLAKDLPFQLLCAAVFAVLTLPIPPNTGDEPSHSALLQPGCHYFNLNSSPVSLYAALSSLYASLFIIKLLKKKKKQKAKVFIFKQNQNLWFLLSVLRHIGLPLSSLF